MHRRSPTASARPAISPVRTGLAVALLIVVGLVAGCSGQRDVTIIKLAHNLDSTHPVHKGMEFLSARLAEKSGGTMRVDIYPSAQLGTEREAVELLQLGGLGMTKVSTSALEGFAEEFKVFALPYLFRDDPHKFAAFDGEIGREILLSPAAKLMRGLCYYEAGSRSFYTKTRPIRTPDDLAGLKIRVQESPMAFGLIRSFGASATPIAFGELYTSLQQGVVDGAENNPPSFHLSRHYEVCKFYSLNEHTSVPDVVLVSVHLWNSLSPQQQTWLQEAADESTVYQRELWQSATDEALAAVQAAGVEIIRPDKTLFAAKAASLHEEASRDPVIGPLARRITALQP